jgi:hypothetical protein
MDSSDVDWTGLDWTGLDCYRVDEGKSIQGRTVQNTCVGVGKRCENDAGSVLSSFVFRLELLIRITGLKLNQLNLGSKHADDDSLTYHYNAPASFSRYLQPISSLIYITNHH